MMRLVAFVAVCLQIGFSCGAQVGFGGDPMSQGPAYWCSSIAIAKKSHMTEYCREHHWNNLGSESCTDGPSYWCASQAQAVECHAVSFCQHEKGGSSDHSSEDGESQEQGDGLTDALKTFVHTVVDIIFSKTHPSVEHTQPEVESHGDHGDMHTLPISEEHCRNLNYVCQSPEHIEECQAQELCAEIQPISPHAENHHDVEIMPLSPRRGDKQSRFPGVEKRCRDTDFACSNPRHTKLCKAHDRCAAIQPISDICKTDPCKTPEVVKECHAEKFCAVILPIGPERTHVPIIPSEDSTHAPNDGNSGSASDDQHQPAAGHVTPSASQDPADVGQGCGLGLDFLCQDEGLVRKCGEERECMKHSQKRRRRSAQDRFESIGGWRR